MVVRCRDKILDSTLRVNGYPWLFQSRVVTNTVDNRQETDEGFVIRHTEVLEIE